MVRVWWGFLDLSLDGWSSSYRSVDLLLKHLGRLTRSEASRNAFCNYIWRICTCKHVIDKMGNTVNPDELVEWARNYPDAVAEVVQNFADEFYKMGSAKYANNIIYIMRSFFKANKVEVDLYGYRQPTRGSRRRREYVPSWRNGEALRMAEVAGSLRNRLLIEFLIFTGLRNSTLRALTYNPSYEDLWLQQYTIKKELERGEEFVVIICHEKMKELIPDACKNRIFYYTFIPSKVTANLRAYLKEREEKYGSIQDGDPIFITENRRVPLNKRCRTPISARELQIIVKQAAKRAGLEHWKFVYPHCLRKTYESFLREQPEDVKLDIKEREFLFGHVLPGSQDAYFDKTKVEEMRAKYARMIFEPITVETEERVVSESELQSFLEQGWRFVATLPSGKIVISTKTLAKKNKPETANGNIISVSSDENLGKTGISIAMPKETALITQNTPIARYLKERLGNINAENIKNLDKAHGLEMWINAQEPSEQTAQAFSHHSNEISARKIKRARQNYLDKLEQKNLLNFM